MTTDRAEPVRLVIWDLDDTFWDGTLTEGGITYRQEAHDIVIALARRGIVSSICSKNDPREVEAELVRRGLWSYFVFPSIDWSPKGPRIASLIEAMQLRPSTVMFVDDNPHNLAEARSYVPAITTAGPEIIPGLLENPLFRGKDDTALSRLQQYRQLEIRHRELAASLTGDAGAAEAFLRDSNITVEIDYDISSHLDRAIELINRTNQLNFTKLRLPESSIEARAELTRLLSNRNVHAGLIRVQDRFGDYGHCGLFVLRHDRSQKRLLHFCFSCRILNLGIETWLFQRLGRPDLTVVGDVVADVKNDLRTIDWVNVKLPDASNPASTTRSFDEVFMNGACQMRPLAHYFATIATHVHEQFDTVRHGRTMPLQHTMFAYYAICGMPPEAMRAFNALGYEEGDFASALPARTPGKRSVWLLNFWTETAGNLYRHRPTGCMIPIAVSYEIAQVMRQKLGSGASDIRNWDPTVAKVDPQLIALVRDEFEYIGPTPPDVLKRNIARIIDYADPAAKIFVLLANERKRTADGEIRQARISLQINELVRDALPPLPNIFPVEVAQCMPDPDDMVVEQAFTLTRTVQYRLFRHILHQLL